MWSVFIPLALLSIFPMGSSQRGKPVPQYDYLCRRAMGLKVCHPINADKYIQCPTSRINDPRELSCRRGLKFSSLRQKCSFAQYGDCLPSVTPEEAALITCPRLLDPPHGKLHCSDQNRYDSLCLLSCVPGHVRQGVLAVRCVLADDEGRWSGEPGHCVKDDARGGAKTSTEPEPEPVRCDELKPDGEGQITCTRRLYTDSVCTLRCPPGLEILGHARVTCGSNGKWDFDLGKCRKPVIKCPALSQMHVTCDEAKCDKGYCHVGTTCSLDCGPTASSVGRVMTTCQESGAWSNELGRCEKSCPALNRDHAAVKCTDSFDPRSSCRLVCNEGFHAAGEEITACQSSGEWDKVLGSCLKEKTCPQITKPSRGDLFCSDSVQLLTAGAPLKRGTLCYVSCGDSFKLKGESMITCTDAGIWSAQVGVCVAKCDTGDLPKVDRGYWSCSGDSNLECRFQCKSRKVPERAKVSCIDGVWTSYSVPSCQEQKKCPKIAAPDHGSLRCSTQILQNGTKCDLECDSGFRLRGSTTTFCVDGIWNEPLGVCESKCNQDQIRDDHGSWTCTGRGLLTCELTCDAGYEVIESLASCANGVWRKSSESICIPTMKYCPLLSAPKDGFLHCNSQLDRPMDVSRINAPAGTSCQIQCDSGFDYRGSRSIDCSASGFWSGPVGSCQSSCNASQLGSVIDGFWHCEGVGDLECSLRCKEPGAVGGQKAKCRNGKWDIDLTKSRPSCQKTLCPLLPRLPHGQVSCIGADNINDLIDPTVKPTPANSACTLQCDDSYSLSGSEFTFCNDEGKWETKLGVCEKIHARCPAIAAPKNGFLSCESFTKDKLARTRSRADSNSALCQVRCDQGYDYRGTEYIRCDEGSWTAPVGVCRQACDRDLLPEVAKGRWSCRGARNLDCNLVCDSPLKSNVDTVECRNGRWNLGDTRPSCEVLACPYLDKRRHGKVECMNADALEVLVDPSLVKVRANGVCQLTCNDGYRIVGPQTSLCSGEGVWKLQLGSCEKACDVNDIRPISHGKWSCSSDSLTSSRDSMLCKSECEKGYSAESPEIARCVNGVWQQPKRPVVCAKDLVLCPLISLPENGVTRCTSELHRHDHMEVDVEPAHEGTYCHTKCNVGFQFRGPSFFNCTSRGSWTPIGACQRQCDPTILPSVERGSWSCAQRGGDLDCSLSCESDYKGSLDRARCQSGLWNVDFNKNLPTCQKQHCSKLPRIANGNIKCTSSSGSEIDPSLTPPVVHSACQLSCDDGFTARGSAISFCLANGQYDSKLGSCEGHCDQSQLTPFARGSWRCQKSGENALQCYTKCESGFRSEEVFAECHQGRWNSYVTPKCVSSSCPRLPEPVNGKISCSSSDLVSGTTCVLLCNDGFSLTGRTVTVCSEGSWMNTFGECRPSGSKTTATTVETNDRPTSTEAGIDGKCLVPQLDAGTRLACKSDSGNALVISNAVPPLSNCQLECSSGFYLHGVSSAYCQHPGVWSAVLGSCRPICTTDQLSSVDNGVWKCQGLEILSCTLQCNPGFQSNGASASCNNGAWDKSLNPSCEASETTSVTQPEGKLSPPTVPESRPDIEIRPVIPNVPIFRSLKPNPGSRPPPFYCPLPRTRRNAGFSCPTERNGRVARGESCFLECEGSIKMNTKCTRRGWFPDAETLSCPSFRLYTFKKTCAKKVPDLGSITCTLQGKLFDGADIPVGGVCSLKCPRGRTPTWATKSTCLDDGSWDNYLNCV